MLKQTIKATAICGITCWVIGTTVATFAYYEHLRYITESLCNGDKKMERKVMKLTWREDIERVFDRIINK